MKQRSCWASKQIVSDCTWLQFNFGNISAMQILKLTQSQFLSTCPRRGSAAMSCASFRASNSESRAAAKALASAVRSSFDSGTWNYQRNMLLNYETYRKWNKWNKVEQVEELMNAETPNAEVETLRLHRVHLKAEQRSRCSRCSRAPPFVRLEGTRPRRPRRPRSPGSPVGSRPVKISENLWYAHDMLMISWSVMFIDSLMFYVCLCMFMWYHNIQ